MLDAVHGLDPACCSKMTENPANQVWEDSSVAPQTTVEPKMRALYMPCPNHEQPKHLIIASIASN